MYKKIEIYYYILFVIVYQILILCNKNIKNLDKIGERAK